MGRNARRRRHPAPNGDTPPLEATEPNLIDQAIAAINEAESDPAARYELLRVSREPIRLTRKPIRLLAPADATETMLLVLDAKARMWRPVLLPPGSAWHVTPAPATAPALWTPPGGKR